ncbi:MAG: 4Fe-4S dicluster protein [Deferribacteraceae bacterium]|jgi:nitroreductase/NAD-dependent dihydropyrimidine dehydrogenase PreA subunit|nr:4Fe-4S dicluster protein [Deferribacteraceae bacterium]
MELNFKVDEKLCIACKNCVEDCPVKIIGFDGLPFVKDDSACLMCQHCLAVCPTGALSIFGKNPLKSINSQEINIDGNELEKFIKYRKTIRKFKQDELPLETINKLIEVTSYAPSGHNSKKTMLTVTGTKKETDSLINLMMDRFEKYLENNRLPGKYGFLKYVLYQYKKKGIDITFRGAPHIIITSIPEGDNISYVDTIIALSYFEIYAHSLNIGTVWSGIGKYYFDLMPELKDFLQIPPGYKIGYLMGFGFSAVKYYRTAQHDKLQHKILGL